MFDGVGEVKTVTRTEFTDLKDLADYYQKLLKAIFRKIVLLMLFHTMYLIVNN